MSASSAAEYFVLLVFLPSKVSRKISELVLENHPSYVTELERVMELQRSLEKAVATCSNGRR